MVFFWGFLSGSWCFLGEFLCFFSEWFMVRVFSFGELMVFVEPLVSVFGVVLVAVYLSLCVGVLLLTCGGWIRHWIRYGAYG